MLKLGTRNVTNNSPSYVMHTCIRIIHCQLCIWCDTFTSRYIPLRYDTMLVCWKMDQTERPTFSQLVVSLSGFLDQLAGYFDLNAENYASFEGTI